MRTVCFLDKGKDTQGCNCRYQVGAACRLPCYNQLLSLSCSHGLCVPQHRPEGHGCMRSTAQNKPGSTQVNCYVDHQLLGVQWPLGQDRSNYSNTSLKQVCRLVSAVNLQKYGLKQEIENIKFLCEYIYQLGLNCLRKMITIGRRQSYFGIVCCVNVLL